MTDEVRIFVYGFCHFYDKLEGGEDAIGNGGYGVVVSINSKKVKEMSGGFSNTTNARMEITGIIEGLKGVEKPGNIIVYLTNGYVLDALNKGWLEKWKAQGFKKKKHADLWSELHKMLHTNTHTRTISFKHSREVRLIVFFNLAEQLAKTVSGKEDLPLDLKQNNKIKHSKQAPPPLTLFNITEGNESNGKLT
jgi:ribonuclease HI